MDNDMAKYVSVLESELTAVQRQSNAAEAMLGLVLIAVGGKVTVPNKVREDGFADGSEIKVTPLDDGGVEVEIV